MLFHLERDNQDHIRNNSASSTTQRYIEADVEAQQKIVDLV